MLILSINDLKYNEVFNKIKSIKKSGWVVQADENTYIVPIFTQSFKEYKETLDRVWKIFDKNLIELEIFNTKDWIIVNRHNFESAIKKK